MKTRRYVRTIAAATLALALTGCAGQAETDDQRVWLNAAEGQATTVVTQEAAQPTEATTIPTEPTLPEETQIPESTEAQELQQEATETTVPLTAETEPLTEETSPPETVSPAPSPTQPPTFPTEPMETVPPETQPTQTEPPETIPKETEPPETEPVETAPPETEPEPESSGDIYSASEAMAVGNSYAASAYGMTVSPELGFGNASYEFADTAYVSGLRVLGGQSYLNQMVIKKIDSLAANLRGAYGADTDLSAYRVNSYVAYDPDGELYWIYVFYG